MAQHDYVIANQTGLEFRQDLNNALNAIVTQNSGASEPSVTYPGMIWLDTSVNPPLRKIRNQANTAFEDIVQNTYVTYGVNAGGTSDDLTANFTPDVTLTNGTTVLVRALSANTTTTPTFSPDSLTAKPIVKGNNLALVAGDIAGAGHWLELTYDSLLDKWVLQNPYNSLVTASSLETQTGTNTTKAVTPKSLADSIIGSVDQSWQDLTASRVINTTYTNTTGRPIFVVIHGVLTATIATTGWFGVDTVYVSYVGGSGAVANQTCSAQVIVPNGSSYKVHPVSGISSVKWLEFR